MTIQQSLRMTDSRRSILMAGVFACAVLACHETSSAQGTSLEQQLLAEDLQELAADARQRGDAARGAVLFHWPGLGCAKCHDSKQDVALGPDLSLWRQSPEDVHLVQSVLRPSEKIDPEYQSLQVLTSDGRSVAGLVRHRDDDSITLQLGFGNTDSVTLAWDDIEAEKRSDVSIMPSGQVNALRRRGEFLDLIAYLIAIRDGGPEAAGRLRPSEESLRLKIPEYESTIDHRGMIVDWNNDSLKRGQKIYEGLCINCHGTIEKPGSLPTSLRFAEGKFKYGSDPYSIYQTLTHGGGLMVPQTWMVPRQKYDVIQYLREHFLRSHNRSQFFQVSEAYLANLPKGDSRGPEPTVIEPWTTMDYGTMLTTTIEFGDDGSNIAQKAIAIRLDDGGGSVSRGKAWVVFEHDTLRMAAAWTDRFVDWNGIQFNGRHGVHLRATGEIHASNPTGPGWADPSTGSFEDDQRVIGRDGRRYGPLPASWGKFRGLYRYENQVILHYTVGETEILERPSLLLEDSTPVFVRTINLGPRNSELEMLVMTTSSDATITQAEGGMVLETDQGPMTVAIPGLEDVTSLRLHRGRLVLRFARGDGPIRGHVVFAASMIGESDHKKIHKELSRLGNDLQSLTRGGPPQYFTTIEAPGRRWFESDAWVVDELTRPEGNPWSARTRITGIDFFPGGDSLAVCTWDGDVWTVSGLASIGTPGGTLRWRRVASGLFQPLGILVAGDRLMVTCRDQLVSLGDTNGDGEMDDYRCFNSDHQVTEHFHEFAMGLQRDQQGNYYYAKSARHALEAVVPHHGTLLRVSPDGSTTDIVATGFRAANGVCLNNDGSYIVTDQEGHWNPKNRINWVRPGGFYGNMYGYHDITDTSDDAMQQPLCWITNEFDRSPAELLWVDSRRWGKLQGQLLNLSYGYGRVYVVPHEHVSMPRGNPQPQGGMCQLPIPDLPTGMIRGRFSPWDGQLYVGGLFSWAGSRQEQEGGLFRIRYKGGRVDLPIGLRVLEGQIEITCTDPLDAVAAADIDRYRVTTWDLKRTKNYGSKHFNERELAITSAQLSDDNKTIRLQIPELQPTWGMEIVCRLRTPAGNEVRRVIHNTVHALGKP